MKKARKGYKLDFAYNGYTHITIGLKMIFSIRGRFKGLLSVEEIKFVEVVQVQ